MAEREPEIKYSSVGKCLFCPLADDAEKREILRATRTEPAYIGFEHKGPRIIVIHQCGLGEIGKDCVLPKLYQLSYEGARTADYVSQQNPRVG